MLLSQGPCGPPSQEGGCRQVEAVTHSSGALALPRGNHLMVGKPRTPNFSPAGGGLGEELGEQVAAL